jgi:hypothetical protein
MDELSDNRLEQIYTELLAEHTRLMSGMKNNSEKFSENSSLMTYVSAVMKDILKLKAYKTKLRMRE